jgi:hypothetical protein
MLPLHPQCYHASHPYTTFDLDYQTSEATLPFRLFHPRLAKLLSFQTDDVVTLRDRHQFLDDPSLVDVQARYLNEGIDLLRIGLISLRRLNVLDRNVLAEAVS